MPVQLTKEQARRIAVRAQLLDARRPADLVDVVQRLTLLQIDPTAAIAPSADLVAWSRLGASYRPEQLKQAVEEDRSLFELDALIRPTSDLGLYLAGASDRPPWEGPKKWLRDNDGFRRDILKLLRKSGPLNSRDIPDTCAVPWASTGWTHNRNVTQMLEFLSMRGEVAVSHREGRDRVWDLAERVYPADVDELSDEEAARLRADRRLGYLGVARPKAATQPVEPIDVGEVGEEATIDGVDGIWRVDPVLLDQISSFEPRSALLSPFDRLVFDRARAMDVFGFEYIVEMYKPAAKRRWGYFALPILHGDSLVGKLDAAADRKSGVFRVAAIHEDEPFTAETIDGVHAEVRELAAWLGLEAAGIPGS